MITLYGFGAGFGLPEISPFVTKTEVQLKMAGLPYRKERAMPPASPRIGTRCSIRVAMSR